VVLSLQFAGVWTIVLQTSYRSVLGVLIAAVMQLSSFKVQAAGKALVTQAVYQLVMLL
jgi:stage V sporulation protein SpoVS